MWEVQPVLEVEYISRNGGVDAPQKVQENSEGSAVAMDDSHIASSRRMHELKCTAGLDRDATLNENPRKTVTSKRDRYSQAPRTLMGERRRRDRK